MSSVFIKVAFDDGTTFESFEHLIADANDIFKSQCLMEAMDKAYDDVMKKTVKLYGPLHE